MTALADLRADLERLGSSADVPSPRAFFVDELEARLALMMQGATDGDLFPDIVVARFEKVRGPRRGFVVSGSIALVIVLLTVGVGAFRSSRSAVGVATSASAADDVADVAGRDGGGVHGDGAGGDRSPGAATASGNRSATLRRVSGGEPVDEVRPITVWPYVDEQALAEAMGSDSGDAASPGSPAAGTGAGAGHLGMRGAGTPATVLLEWDRYEGAGFAAYLVLRAAAPDTPEYPDPSDRTMVLLRIENRDQVSHRDTGKVGTTPRYRVVAVDRAGNVLARTDVYESDMAGATGRISQLPKPPTS